MPASKPSRRSGTHHNHSSHNQDNRRGSGKSGSGNGTGGSRESNYTLDEARRFLDNMPVVERRRIDAYLESENNSFAEAARALGCDPETVSRTWNKYKRMIKLVALDINGMKPA